MAVDDTRSAFASCVYPFFLYVLAGAAELEELVVVVVSFSLGGLGGFFFSNASLGGERGFTSRQYMYIYFHTP